MKFRDWFLALSGAAADSGPYSHITSAAIVLQYFHSSTPEEMAIVEGRT